MSKNLTLNSSSIPPSPSPLKNSTESAVVAEWKRRIQLGIKWRYKISGFQDKNWELFSRYYKGDWWESNELGDIPLDKIDSYLPANRVFSYIKAVLPRVYFRNPGIVVTKGKIIDNIDDKEIIQLYIDYLIKELKLKKTMKRVLLSVFLTGTGIVKEGYGSEFIPGQETTLPLGQRIEYNSTIKTGLPWVKYVNPTHFVVPWGTTDFEDCRWCAELVIRQLDDVKDDKNYKHRDKFKASSTERLDKGPKEVIDSNTKKANWVRLWEIRDKKTRKFFVISEGSDSFHFNDEDILSKESLPYRVVIFDEDLSSMWGISAVKIMEPQQLELNDIKTQMSAHRKREVTKWAIDPKGPISKKTIEDFNDASKPMAAVIIRDPEKNIKLISASMPSDLRLSAEDADNDIRFEIGFSRNQAGEVSTGRRTAREIDVAREASEIRNDERRDIASDLFEDIIHDLMLISFDHVNEEMVKKITGGVSWHPRDTEEIIYDFSLQVHPEEARPISTGLIRAEANELYDRLLQSPVANPVTGLVDIVKAYGKRDVSDYIDPEIAQIVQQVILKREEAQKQEQEQGGGER